MINIHLIKKKKNYNNLQGNLYSIYKFFVKQIKKLINIENGLYQKKSTHHFL